ncbi:MAG TPA: hypothetical protein VI756_20430 [Blastocatellia bacterium]
MAITPNRHTCMAGPDPGIGLAIPSSGDPVKDQQELEAAHKHEQRVRRGICPNGCGPMVWRDHHNRECRKCGFNGWVNVPYDGAGKETVTLLAKDHPEANGREVRVGEVEWELRIPLEGRRDLVVRMGEQSRARLCEVLLGVATDEAEEALRAMVDEAATGLKG